MSNSKKILSVLLALALVLSAAVIPAGAYNTNCDYSRMTRDGYSPRDSYTVDENTPYSEEAIIACGGSLEDTQTIYFQAPEDWANEYNTFEGPDDSEPYMHVCAYWWMGIGYQWQDGTQEHWVGYQAHLVDKANRIYSIRMPNDGNSPMVVWNNGVNSGMDETAPYFRYGRQLMETNTEGAYEGDFDTIPEGSPTKNDFDGCIQIVDYTISQTNILTDVDNYGYNWYIYYGDGCYGSYAPGSTHYTSKYENCKNPEHLANPDYYHSGTPVEPTEYISPSEYVDPSEHQSVYPGDPSRCLNFDVSTTGWSWFGKVGFYIVDITDGYKEFKPWGNKTLFKSAETSYGIWSYDPYANGMDLEDGKQYYVIFVNQNSGAQTAPLIFDTTCLGDTAYCNGDTQENEYDSNKTSQVACWKNSWLGPMKCITSIGNVVGTTIPNNTTAYDMFVDFLKNTFDNARTYSGKDDQTLLDDTAFALGLDRYDVGKAIEEAGVYTDWDPNKSYLPGEIYVRGFYEEDGFTYYMPDDETAILYEYTANKVRAEIPAAVNDHKVTAIYNSAFANSELLKTVIIPDTVTYIGDSAFSSCISLFNLTIPGSVKTIRPYAFYNCTNLRTVTLPNGVESIGASAFSECKNLSEINVANSVYKIGCRAVEGTKWIADQPAGPMYLGKVFYGYKYDSLGEGFDRTTNGYVDYGRSTRDSADVITVPDRYPGGSSGGSSGSGSGSGWGTTTPLNLIESIDIKAGTIGIADGAFSNYNSKIKKVTIPDSVKYIGEGAFSGCSALESAALPKGLEEIGSGAFANCSSLKSIKLPGSVGKLGISVFKDCEALESAVLPNGIAGIGNDMFYGCKKLSSVNIPSSAAYIDSYAFRECDALESLYISPNITEIAPNAFLMCNGLTVKCVADSYAQQYSSEYEIPFVNVEPPTGFTVSGAITSYLSDSDVAVKLTGSDNDFTATVTGKEDYSIENVPAGEYILSVEKADHAAREYAVTVTDSDVTQDVKICPKGDVTQDGKTTQFDYVWALAYSRELREFDDYQIKCGDVFGKGDGKVTIADANRIAQHARDLNPLYETE